jgi:pimeloyl-ACP methyl ester carboxylesterase
MHCKEPMTTLFNDLPASVSETWLAKLQCQPATGWADVIEYAGWKDIPSVFLVCEKDAALPAALQVQSVEMAGSEIERCESGHMVMLSMPDTVVEVIRKAAGEAI